MIILIFKRSEIFLSFLHRNLNSKLIKKYFFCLLQNLNHPPDPPHLQFLSLSPKPNNKLHTSGIKSSLQSFSAIGKVEAEASTPTPANR